jgi:hypothetical protein
MRHKWAIAGSLGAVLLVVLAVVLPGHVSPGQSNWNEWRTLASLRRVDDYPLYVMTYYGDYDFKGLMQAGAEADAEQPLSYQEIRYAWACTCFSSLNAEGDVLLGRNFDWYTHPALLLFTDPPDGYASVSMVDISYLGFGRETPSWTERRRLLYAPHLPFDGINERGLGVGMMAVPYAEAGRDPQEVTLDSLQAIRLLLDYAQDVEEATSLLADYNIDFAKGPPVHYLLVDASGHSAVVEFVDGEMNVLRNQEPWQVSTNFVISEAMPEGTGSECWRYNTAYEVLEGANGSLSPDEAMALLNSVSQSSTIWSLVYNLSTGDIQVAMNRKYDRVHEFKLER